MFEGLYSRMTKRVDYRALLFVPLVIALLLVAVIAVRGIPLSIDFLGGTWIEVTPESEISAEQLQEIRGVLEERGLESLKVSLGYDINTQEDKLTIVTASVISESNVTEMLWPYVGDLSSSDVAVAEVSAEPPVEMAEKLEQRFGQRVLVDYDNGTLTITALELNAEELESSLEYYLGEDVEVRVSKKNLNMRSIGPTLGKTFREQGIKAVMVAFLLMAIVVFLAFRDIIPSIAVLQAALVDVIFALGGMNLLGIELSPASLAALLMLIGYSVDTDVMLTSRVLKERAGEVTERIDNAMPTGLTMTFTTLSVMLVVFIISTEITRIETLSSIASVLLIGLFGDVLTTWFTNAGILRWYLESPHSKKKVNRRSRFSIFSK